MASPVENEMACARTALLCDLRLKVGECALIKLALDAVAAFAPELPGWCNPTSGGCNPRMLLTLLTYSYAASSHASEDIEWDCQQDPATRYITANVSVDQDTIRAFRRGNRPWIEACLAWVLEHASDPNSTVAATGEHGLANLETPSDSPYLILARRRLELAILMDMAMAD